MKVLYATLTHGAPRVEWLTGAWLLNDYETAKGEESLIGARHIAVGPYISRNRNEITMLMMEKGLDAVFMVDHDVFTPPQTLERLVGVMEETGAGVVAGDLVLGATAPTTGFHNSAEDGRKFLVAEKPKGPVGRVQTAASSCILVAKRVFEKISAKRDDPPYFGPGTWWMHWPLWDHEKNLYRELGEDFAFSKRVEAVGEMILLHYELGLEHWKVGKMISHLKEG